MAILSGDDYDFTRLCYFDGRAIKSFYYVGVILITINWFFESLNDSPIMKKSFNDSSIIASLEEIFNT